MKQFKFVLLTVLFVLLMSMAVAASAQDMLTTGTSVTGSYAGSEQAYTLEATGGQLVIISMESDAFDTIVTINDTNGAELGRDDDGGEGSNSLLAYLVQADGTFTVMADAWSGEGDYTLTANIVDPAMIEMGSSVTLDPDGAKPLYAAFSASAGQVVNLAGTSATDDDTRLTVYGVDGAEIDSDDDDGASRNPYLRRVVLPEAGLYLVVISSIFDSDLTGTVDVAVEQTEQLFIDATPQTFELHEDVLGTEVFTFNATSGTIYRIIVDNIVNETGIQLELLDTGSFFDPDFEVSEGVRATWDYRATQGGQIRIDVHPSFFSDGDTYTISLEVVE